MAEVIATAVPVDGPNVPGATMQRVRLDNRVQRVIITDTDGRTPLGTIGYVDEIISGLFHCRLVGMDDWHDVQYADATAAMSWVYDQFAATRHAYFIAREMYEHKRGLTCVWERDAEVTRILAMLGQGMTL